MEQGIEQERAESLIAVVNVLLGKSVNSSQSDNASIAMDIYGCRDKEPFLDWRRNFVLINGSVGSLTELSHIRAECDFVSLLV